MDEFLQRFYSTLDPKKFKYFVKDEEYVVYDSDIKLLPSKLQTKSRSVRLNSIDSIVREMLVTRGISVEEYTNRTLTRSGTPTNYGGFMDICLSDSITPTVCAILLPTENGIVPGSSLQPGRTVEFAYLSDGSIMKTAFADDDLLSRTYSLVSSHNCIEILYTNPQLERIFNNWGVSSILSKPREASTPDGCAAAEMLKHHLKADFEIFSFDCQDCCLVDIKNYDLVDFNCHTPQGKRLLAQWLRSPLISQDEIEKRLNFSELFLKVDISLSEYPDIKRSISKILNKRITVQEISKLYQLIDKIPCLLSILEESVRPGQDNQNARNEAGEAHKDPIATTFTNEFIRPLRNIGTLLNKMKRQIEDKIDLSSCCIKTEYAEELAHYEREQLAIYNKIEQELLRVKRDLPNAKYSNRALKIPRSAYTPRLFEEKHFVVISILKTGVTFVTRALSELRTELELLESKIAASRLVILNALRDLLPEYVPSLEIYNYIIALADIFKAFSVKTVLSGYSRPVFDNNRFEAEEFFHPLLEGTECVLNSIYLKNKRMCILTGPNMGGKSTVLKALSMLALYGQIGCYVPAKKAVLPIFDRVFLRVGAQDFSSRGLSTFMVEMLDMKRILATATANSLVLIDELGRGTSAIDGLALATAIRDYLLQLGCYTLIATHFSTLQTESATSKRMGMEDGVLTYRLEDGLCDASFGLKIAEMAGFPNDVLESARKYLSKRD